MGDLVQLIGDLLEWINHLDGPGSVAFLRTVDPIAFSAVTKPTREWGERGVLAWLQTTEMAASSRDKVVSACPDGATFLGKAPAVDVPEQDTLGAAVSDAAEWDRCWDIPPHQWTPGAMRVFLRLITTQSDGAGIDGQLETKSPAGQLESKSDGGGGGRARDKASSAGASSSSSSSSSSRGGGSSEVVVVAGGYDGTRWALLDSVESFHIGDYDMSPMGF